MAEAGAGPFVAKKVFELPRYETLGGRTIENVRIGWESWGTLNEDRSNAILVCHFFSGTSHAAGRYAATDPLPGYWDAIIGPGKAIDTDRYFVLSSDTLVNLSARDPNVVTTGPASIDPRTGAPYGLEFPVVQIGDFVRVQRELVKSLGITRLHAVAGPSMGGLQTFDWAVRFPDMVGRIIPVIAAGAADAWLIGWLDAWVAPIRVDAAWKRGAYYGGPEPLAGLTEALKLVGLHANSPAWANPTFGSTPAPGENPTTNVLDRYAVVATLAGLAADRAAVGDANHMLYLARANQLFVAGSAGSLEDAMAQVRAPVLYVTAPDDEVFPPRSIERTLAALLAGGTSVEHVTVTGPFGHLNGLASIGEAAGAISRFLGAP